MHTRTTRRWDVGIRPILCKNNIIVIFLGERSKDVWLEKVLPSPQSKNKTHQSNYIANRCVCKKWNKPISTRNPKRAQPRKKRREGPRFSASYWPTRRHIHADWSDIMAPVCWTQSLGSLRNGKSKTNSANKSHLELVGNGFNDRVEIGNFVMLQFRGLAEKVFQYKKIRGCHQSVCAACYH